MDIGGALHSKLDVQEIRGEAALGARFQGLYYVKQTDKNGDLVTAQVSAGTTSTLRKAWSRVVSACKLRDASPAEGKSDIIAGQDLLSSHFRSIVVSPLFAGLTHVERLDMIFDALLFKRERADMGTEQARGELNFSFLIFPQLAFELMTPAQYKPQLHEQCGHKHYRTIANRAVQPESKVAMHIKETESPNMIRALLSRGNRLQSAHEAKKVSPLGHFFHSLPKHHQNFLLARQRLADKALERAQSKALGKSEESKSKASTLSTSLRDPRSLQHRQVSDVMIINNEIKSHLAKRIQRIYRNALLLRALRRRSQRQSSIIQIQKRFRACYGRLFAVLFAKIALLGATRIETRCRIQIAARRSKQFHVHINVAVRRIQKTLRQHQAHHYVAWILRNWRYAARLQHLVRQKLSTFKHSLQLCDRVNCHDYETGERLGTNSVSRKLTLMAAQLSSAMRSMLCRLRYDNKVLDEAMRKVVNPALYLQGRIARGYLGREAARRVRRRHASAVEIQRLARGHAKTLWRKQARHLELKQLCTMRLQSMARGYLDRIYVHLKQHQAFQVRLSTIVLPALQACARRMLAMRATTDRRHRIHNTVIIQRIWRLIMQCRKAKAGYEQKLMYVRVCATTLIARQVRGLIAQKRFMTMHHAATGHRIKSARTILRAWLRYRSVKRFSILKGAWDVEKSAKNLMAWHTLRGDVRFDMSDVRADVKDIRISRRWSRKRLRSLREFIVETELRLPKVELQKESLDTSGIENGWGEALENEWERLTSQLVMAVEEKRLIKIHSKHCEAQLLELQLEYEEMEADIDDIAAREQEEFELLRRLEIKRADLSARAGWQERVRHERMRWRVRNVRARLLQRQARSKTELFHKALKKREITISSTLSTCKRAHYVKAALREASRQDDKMRLEILQAAATDKEGSMSKLKACHDNIIQGCSELLRGAAAWGEFPKLDN